MNLKKLALSVTLASTVIGGTVIPQDAEAALRSYYDRIESISNESTKLRLTERYIKFYHKITGIYQKTVDRYSGSDKAAHKKIVKLYQARVDFYTAEIEKYENLKTELTSTGLSVVYQTDSSVERKNYIETETLAPTLVSEEQRVVEETTDNIVKVYAEIIKTYETITRTKSYLEVTVTTTYSDGSVKVGKPATRLLKTEDETNTHTTTDREFVREYALVVETVEEEEVVDATEEETAPVSSTVLTFDEYVARDDVDLSFTDTYRNAVLTMNSRVNPDYADRISESYGKTLEAVGAPVAWSRGYTGKGSTIAILDTGIDLDHSEFEGRIAGTACFAGTCDHGETVQDNNRFSHGTHVAGIAAAALDGVGTTGVAPDAELLVAKVAYDSGFYQFSAAAKALAWAAENGATVANMSGNVMVMRTYSNAMEELPEKGVYRLTDEKQLSYGYGTAGYNNMMTNSATEDMIKAMQGNEMVAVVSAGNQRLAFSNFPAHLAIAENADGSLKLGGRMLVVGNWDLRGQRLNSASNKAGTVCLDYDDSKDTCGGNYRIKDFYILAPGSYVASTDNNGEYVTRSGTSMAAPVVSGAVAVVHQMWPHMTGDNLVKLLLTTADKTIKNYDENIHGQGLLDLDEATKPQGALGIPTTGRASGNVATDITGTMSVAGGSISALEEVMAIDAYDRDFYFNANDLVATADTRTISYTVAHKDLRNTNAYAGYAYTQNLAGEQTLVGMSSDGNELSLAYDFANGMTVGLLTEDKSFLGNTADSAIMRVNNSTTVYAGYNKEYDFNDITVFGGATAGVTTLDVDTTTMLKDADALVSNTANIGAKYNMRNSEFGVVASLPVAITSGNANFQVADSVNADGTINYKNVDSSLAVNAREYNVGAFYNLNFSETANVSMYAEQRYNYAGVQGKDTVEAGIEFKVNF